MAFTKATLIQRIRHLLRDNSWRDACTEAMDASEVDLSVANSARYAVGSIVEFQDDGEQCYVSAITDGTTLAVTRGVNGTTASTHSSGAVIVKNPGFSYKQIEEAIGAAIRGLWPYVYKKIETTVTPVVGEKFYAPTTGTLDISSAVQLTTDDPDKPFFYGTRRSAYPIFLHQNVPTAFSQETGGTTIEIPHFRNTTNDVLVNGIGKITTTVATGDYSDLTDGVEVDCVAYYAAARLVMVTDISRTTLSDVSMNDQSVRPGTRTSIGQMWKEEAKQLRNQWEEDLRYSLPRMNRGR